MGISFIAPQGTYTAPAKLITKTITSNDTYNAVDDNANGYSSVTVSVSGGGGGDYEVLTHTLTDDDGYIYLKINLNYTQFKALVTSGKIPAIEITASELEPFEYPPMLDGKYVCTIISNGSGGGTNLGTGYFTYLPTTILDLGDSGPYPSGDVQFTLTQWDDQPTMVCEW